MASFPTSAKSFAARSNGQTIDAAHVGDLQDEVNAIEDGYLNGSARLNSSGSTMVSLSVTGGSTFSSRVTFHALPYVMPSSGGSTGEVLTIVSTSGSTMGLEWRASVAAVPDAALLKTDTEAIAIAGGSTAPILWTKEDFLTNSSMHSTGTNPARVIPQSTGIYSFAFQFGGESNNAGAFQLLIEDSSGGRIAYTDFRSASTTPRGGTVSGLKRFDVLGGYAVAVVVPVSTNQFLSTVSFFSVVKL